MASEAVFSYGRPLWGCNIRLIKIKPGCQNTTMEISLVERELESVAFETLSYVWGKQTTQERIKCNGLWMSIGSSLLDIFKELARRRTTEFIWADAICINQKDNQEKTRQVRMMRTIYEKAQRVIIWLGGEQVGDKIGFKLAQSLYVKCDGKNYSMKDTTYDFKYFDCESKGLPWPLGDPNWNALFTILSHSWFSRIWVVQELLVAQSSVIWRGAQDLETDIVLWVAMHVARHKNLYESFNIFMDSPPSSALMARNIATGYLEYKGSGPLPIYDTLSRYNGMEATDPRDRYFALAGIAQLDASFVNYEKSYHSIACLVGKMALLDFPGYHVGPAGAEVLTRKSKPHRFLIEWLAFHANPQNHKLRLPSWVPDMISPHSPGFLMSGFYNTLLLPKGRAIPAPKVRLRQGAFFDWSGLSMTDWMIPVPDEIDIRGAVFAQVGTLASMRPSLPSSKSLSERFGQGHTNLNTREAADSVSSYETKMVYWLSEIRRLADPTLGDQDSIMSGSEESFDAFWRTLVYNRESHFNYESPNKKPEAWVGNSFGYWYLWKKLQMKRPGQQNKLQEIIFSECLKKLAGDFDMAEGRVRDARRFFVSKDGRFGWVPFRTKVGDKVCVFQGMRIPVIMRPRGNRWEFIGACYVHGWMDGEIWDIDGLNWGFMSFV